MEITDLSQAFKIERIDASARSIVPRRIESIRPTRMMPNFNWNEMKRAAYEFAELQEYDDCWTGEMARRPIPFISTDPRPAHARDLLAKHLPAVLAFLAPKIKPHFQTYNKESNLGYPINGNPGLGLDDETGIKTHMSKFDVILTEFHPMYHGDFTAYVDAYNTQGVRKQNEPPSKVRTYQFINSSGDVYQADITAADRSITVPQLGAMIGSRTRVITRPDVVNLYLQCWDTMLHSAIMETPLCHTNVYTRETWPDDAVIRSFDCKHYERYLGMAAIAYADVIGGIYQQQLLRLIHAPSIVPDDEWKHFFLIRARYGPGEYPQFGSGICNVATLGKLTNICAQVEYFSTALSISPHDAIPIVFEGSSHGLRRWCYGDDNRVMGSRDATQSFIDFMGEVFEIEEDEVPHYLGTVYRPDIRRFVLPADTYNLKLYQPERDVSWKDYPNLGMLKRREIFALYGEPEIGRDILPYEDALWLEQGVPFHAVVSAAAKEASEARLAGVRLSEQLLTDKEYLLSEQQKIASGLYWHLDPVITAAIVNRIVGESVRNQLTFRDADARVMLPKPASLKAPLITEVQEKADNYGE
jgi:hypothetical protein